MDFDAADVMSAAFFGAVIFRMWGWLEMRGFRDAPIRKRSAFLAEGQPIPHGRVSEFFTVSRHTKPLPGKAGTPLPSPVYHLTTFSTPHTPPPTLPSHPLPHRLNSYMNTFPEVFHAQCSTRS